MRIKSGKMRGDFKRMKLTYKYTDLWFRLSRKIQCSDTMDHIIRAVILQHAFLSGTIPKKLQRREFDVNLFAYRRKGRRSRRPCYALYRMKWMRK